MDYIQTRILKQQDVKFFTEGLYALHFDVEKRSFRFNFGEEKPFYLDFLALEDLFTYLRSFYDKDDNYGSDIFPYEFGNEENKWLGEDYYYSPKSENRRNDSGNEENKWLSVNCYSKRSENGRKDYINLKIITKTSQGKFQNEDCFLLKGENLISNILKSQSEIVSFMREYELYERTKLSNDISSSNRLIICFEGNIGSGKSSIINSHFTSDPEVSICPEYYDELKNKFGLTLKDLSGNLKYDFFSSELYKFINMNLRCKDHCKNQIKDIRQKFILMERCALTTKHVLFPFYHNKGFLDINQKSILMQLDEIVNCDKYIPDVVIYVQTDPIKAFERIQARKKEEERSITIGDIKSLDAEYEKYLIILKDVYHIPVFRIDGTKSMEDIKSDLIKLKLEMRDLLKKKLAKREKNIGKGEEDDILSPLLLFFYIIYIIIIIAFVVDVVVKSFI
nr:MAG: deoxynucleoside kinase-like protein [Porcellio scaber clopovirus]